MYLLWMFFNCCSSGLWNVPYVTNVYLIHGYLIPKLVGAYGEGDEDADMAVCSRMRDLVCDVIFCLYFTDI